MRGLVQDVTIPALGMAMTGAVLTRWYKEPGETVAAGEAIAEIETDKSAVDLESPADGVLGSHLVAEAAAQEKPKKRNERRRRPPRWPCLRTAG